MSEKDCCGRCAAPAGYVLVPREPTDAMLLAYTGGALTEAGFTWCKHQWAAMLAAAPAAPAEPVNARLAKALQCAVNNVPELATVPGIADALAAIAAAEAQPKVAPLTEWQIESGFRKSLSFVYGGREPAFTAGVRFAERAHGIGAAGEKGGDR